LEEEVEELLRKGKKDGRKKQKEGRVEESRSTGPRIFSKTLLDLITEEGETNGTQTGTLRHSKKSPFLQGRKR